MASYTTPESVCQFLALDATKASILADVTFMLDYAEYLVENYMGTSYVYTAEHTAKVFNGLDTDMLTMVPVIASVEKVELLDADGVVAFLFEDIVPQPNNPKNGGYRWLQRRRGAIFPAGLANIKVTGRFGTPTVPKGLAMACALVTQHMFNLRRHNEFVRYEMNGERQVYQISPKEIKYIPTVAADILDGLLVRQIELSE